MTLLIILAVAVLAWAAWTWNRLTALRAAMHAAWASVDALLKRRTDLIPNLVAVVKGAMDFESDTLQRVVEARGAALGASAPADRATAERELAGTVNQLFAVVERYPELQGQHPDPRAAATSSPRPRTTSPAPVATTTPWCATSTSCGRHFRTSGGWSDGIRPGRVLPARRGDRAVPSAQPGAATDAAPACGCSARWWSAPLAAQDTGWVITGFDAAYVVNPDRTISVVERIEVDFGSLQRHGIYREIPVKYNRVLKAGLPINAGRVKVDISRIVVNDAAGRALGTDVTRGDRVRIRIGDAATFVTGVQTYVIHYQLERGLGFFDTHDELYWQVTGTEWPVPILRASATITIPAGMGSGSGWGAWCYAGWYESSSSERCSAERDGSTFRFASQRLEPGEGLTAVAAFPKDVIAEPTAADKLRDVVALLWPITLPVGVLAFMTVHWRRRGRDPDPGSVVPYWKPPTDLHPGLAGTLWDQSSDMNDIVATILDLTVRGFIRITEVPPAGLLAATSDSVVGKFLRALGVGETDWKLERINAAGESNLAEYETLVIDGIFGGGESRTMSELNNEFYKEIPKIHKSFYEATVAQGLFVEQSDQGAHLVCGGRWRAHRRWSHGWWRSGECAADDLWCAVGRHRADLCALDAGAHAQGYAALRATQRARGVRASRREARARDEPGAGTNH